MTYATRGVRPADAVGHDNENNNPVTTNAIAMNKAAPIHTGSFCIPADHPCLPGHMPGEPIVPGALLIDRAMDLIAAHGLTPAQPGPMTVKFLGPVSPGDIVELRCDRSRTGAIAFEGVVGTRLVFSGRVETAS